MFQAELNPVISVLSQRPVPDHYERINHIYVIYQAEIFSSNLSFVPLGTHRG